MSKYYVIACGEDGFWFDSYTDKKEMFEDLSAYEDIHFLDTFPKSDIDMYYGNPTVFIIEGEFKTPKPVEVVKSYDL